MTTLITIMLIIYLCLGLVAGCYLLSYNTCLEVMAENAPTKQKYHKLKTKADWITILSFFMIVIPLIIGFLTLMIL